MSNVRIPIPRSAEELLKLAELIIEKHQSDGKESILNALPMEKLTDLVNKAKSEKKARERTQRESVKLTESYRQALGLDSGQGTRTPNTILYIVVSIRDVLLGMNKGHEKRIGDHGFTVLNGLANSTADDVFDHDQNDDAEETPNEAA